MIGKDPVSDELSTSSSQNLHRMCSRVCRRLGFHAFKKFEELGYPEQRTCSWVVVSKAGATAPSLRVLHCIARKKISQHTFCMLEYLIMLSTFDSHAVDKCID